MRNSIYQKSRKVIMALFMMATCSFSSFASEPNTLNIKLSYGESLVFHLSQFPKITFSGKNATIKCGDKTIAINADEISDFYYTSEKYTGIEQLEGNRNVVMNDQELCINNKSNISIYTIEGKLILNKNNFKGMINLSILPKGVLLININNTTIKYYN